MKKFFVSAAAISLLASAGAASAADNHIGQLTIQAEITDGCKISFEGSGSQSGTISFGKIDRNNFAGATRDGSFFVNCGVGSDVRVDLDAGQNGEGNISQRKMKNQNGEGTLRYQVYQGAYSFRKVWGMGDNKDGYYIDAKDTTEAAPTANKFVVELPKESVSSASVNGVYKDVLTATVYYNNRDAEGDNNS